MEKFIRKAVVLLMFGYKKEDLDQEDFRKSNFKDILKDERISLKLKQIIKDIEKELMHKKMI